MANDWHVPNDPALTVAEAQKQAKDMAVESGKINTKIEFMMASPEFGPIPCIWLDPFLGLIQIKGQEEVGFITAKELPAGTVIWNQKVMG